MNMCEIAEEVTCSGQETVGILESSLAALHSCRIPCSGADQLAPRLSGDMSLVQAHVTIF